MKHVYTNALLCLVLVATLVGCNKKVADPKPTVTVLTAEGYTTGEKHLLSGDTLKFGFDAAANAETNEKLSKFQMFISNGTTVIYDTVFTINNEDRFHCEGEFCFTKVGNWQIVGHAFDNADEKGAAYINIHVQDDMETNFTWQQIGQGEVEGFGDYGLLWIDTEVLDSINIVLDTIRLVPADDSIALYVFDPSKWDEIDSYDGKTALFKDIIKNPKNYKDNKISAYEILAAEEAVTYNEIIAVMDEKENGESHLLLINNSFSEDYNSERHLTVNGKLK